MIGFGKTHLGVVRQNNEDSILVSNDSIGSLENLYIISDGMGGHNAGEVASGKAIEFFIEHVKAHEEEVTEDNLEELMRKAVEYANGSVYSISCEDESMSGMGATFTAMSFRGGKCYIAHLGDSRAYVAKSTEICQLTDDHTYVNDLVRASIISNEQARTHHLRNVITRALGSEIDCQVDTCVYLVQEGDSFLLCSDGLSTMLEDETIAEIVTGGGNNEDITDKLIDLANEKGGHDNISVIMIGKGGAES